MKDHGAGLSARILFLGLLFLVGASLPAAAASRVIERDLPAAGIESLRLQGGNGSLRVTAGDGERLGIRVELSPKRWTDTKPLRSIRSWFLSSSYDKDEDLMAAIRLDLEPLSEGRLSVGLTPAGSGRKDRVSEEWTLVVPARLAVRARMDYAEIEIAGVAGGIDIGAGAGSIEVDVPRGDLRVELTVGDVEVRNGSGSVGDVELRSVVGSTRLVLNGMRLEYPDPPGPGSEISVAAEGEDTVRIAVEVGDIAAEIGR